MAAYVGFPWAFREAVNYTRQPRGVYAKALLRVTILHHMLPKDYTLLGHDRYMVDTLKGARYKAREESNHSFARGSV
ncbi:hypothetical protein ACLOJK_032090 [Asimina triloba]